MKYIIITAGVDPATEPQKYNELKQTINTFITGNAKVLILPAENGITVTLTAVPEDGDSVVITP